MYEQTVMNAGSFFLGIGVLILMSVLAWFLYHLARPLKNMADIDERISTFEMLTIDTIANKKGIDLAKEVKKRKISERKTFYKSLQKEMIKEMFEENSKTK